MKSIKILSDAVPLTDKLVLSIGTAATATASMIGEYLNYTVAGLTCLVLIPRVAIAWRDWLRKRVDEKVAEKLGEE